VEFSLFIGWHIFCAMKKSAEGPCLAKIKALGRAYSRSLKTKNKVQHFLGDVD
jgi:hypothetical protein